MLIPIRCFTCGKVIADKYDKYLAAAAQAQQQQAQQQQADGNNEQSEFFHGAPTGEIMTKMGLTRTCCRRMMLGAVDMMNTI